MVKNIAIIAGIALAAFLAVIAIPLLIDTDDSVVSARSEGGESDTAERSSSGARADASDAASSNSGPRNPRQPAAALEAQLQIAAQQVNAGGPVVIDSITTMTSAQARGNRIRYRYEVSQQMAAAQIRQLETNIGTMNQQTICGRADARQLIELGGEIEYAYYGPSGDLWFTTPIVDC
jgi:hypothetical protein